MEEHIKYMKLRTVVGYSQATAAELCGVSLTRYAAFELGRSPLPHVRLALLDAALSVARTELKLRAAQEQYATALGAWQMRVGVVAPVPEVGDPAWVFRSRVSALLAEEETAQAARDALSARRAALGIRVPAMADRLYVRPDVVTAFENRDLAHTRPRYDAYLQDLYVQALAAEEAKLQPMHTTTSTSVVTTLHVWYGETEVAQVAPSGAVRLTLSAVPAAVHDAIRAYIHTAITDPPTPKDTP